MIVELECYGINLVNLRNTRLKGLGASLFAALVSVSICSLVANWNSGYMKAGRKGLLSKDQG